MKKIQPQPQTLPAAVLEREKDAQLYVETSSLQTLAQWPLSPKNDRSLTILRIILRETQGSFANTKCAMLNVTAICLSLLLIGFSLFAHFKEIDCAEAKAFENSRGPDE